MAAAVEEEQTLPPAPAPLAEEPTYKTLTPSAEETQPHSETTEATSASSSSGLAAGERLGKSTDRDEALAKLNQDRTVSHIRAWEEMEKAKAANKYNKTIAKINGWENAEKAAAEASLKKKEEALEKKRAAFVEKMKNKIAAVHRSAEEQRAMAEATRGEEFVKVEELAAKYRAHGKAPKTFLCFRT
ncbi:hypothetical protein GOP47_0007559 [Adiantum capillus-veneris]|uniref:Remorin C-terminal domain-containing protein n=1 Tax=Adiantum capillus-veneris TaxID=13818 RepID=A0A9D4V1I1_ADICA|nr:hypothetical protein GOP47_0007559 [Adiantum capillus-veneris]